MGTYRAEQASADAIVLRHEGEDDHTIEVHAGISGAAGSGSFAPVPSWLQSQVVDGGRYVVSLSISGVAEAPAAVEPVEEAAPAAPDASEQSFDAAPVSEVAEPDEEAPAPSEPVVSSLPAWAVAPDQSRTSNPVDVTVTQPAEADETTADS